MGRNKVVLKTLLYSDIFDYPLRKEEIWDFLISEKEIDKKDFLSGLTKDMNIQKQEKFYFIKGREELVSLRKNREAFSLEKIKKANSIARFLSLIPTVKFIGISGSLALKNSNPEEDIDFFVITAGGSLWVTRFLMVTILKVLRKYREKKSLNVKDKICLNMFISEDSLQLSKQRQNLFTAHEVIQVLPVFSRDHTYEKFLRNNKWIGNFLVNFKAKKPSIEKEDSKALINFLKLTESVFYKLQLFLMKKDITSEEVGRKIAAFHPVDYSRKTMKEYEKRLKKYE